jgi:hypothetical protein
MRIVVISLLISASAFAQQSAGSIAGRVVDPQGGSTQGALVEIEEPVRAAERVGDHGAGVRMDTSTRLRPSRSISWRCVSLKTSEPVSSS